ncbi:unnamed protein product [Rotaria magnacalcarata]|uniref:Reverse transcriptase domain-containing protein n=3 Tax=Rotaria magnacalcarata TaxID=392030 RepID=A0A815UND0_9BILA|nr:unnamed protein product [Rotaria magnacalcarata]
MGIQVTKVDSKRPNVCAIDVKTDESLRIIGVYASDSRSWSWEEISPLITSKCVIFGDFNVDVFQDSNKSEKLLHWADMNSLAPFTPDTPTSLRSDRVIDYALARGVNINVQTYKCRTTSDHLPILSSIPVSIKQNLTDKNVHWKVFSLFSEYTSSFWEKSWDSKSIDDTYADYVKFLFLLSARCTVTFPLNKYRVAIPAEVRAFMSYVRALSFRQLRTKSSFLKNEVRRLRKIAKNKLSFFFSNQLSTMLRCRNTSAPISATFWSRTKRFLKPSSSSLHALIDPAGDIIKDHESMCEVAANFYEDFFKEQEVVRPHPYTDTPLTNFDNTDEPIPDVSLDELLEVVHMKRKKKSVDAHGISNFMFNFLSSSNWTFLLNLYNCSFQSSILPRAWKDTRIILLAKKESICSPSATRPISLLDVFQKVGEKLFLTRFQDVLYRRGLLPDNQSGFRDNFRLQTRVILFLEDVYSLMANSAPVCTILIDFRSAFDQLWYTGCIGKLRRLGVPLAYLNWIEAWLCNRRAFIEVNGNRSRWFNIGKGGPQGGILTPCLFIAFHCDMGQFLSGCTSHFFADDLAAIVSGQIGLSYTDQCLDLEKRIKLFLDQLEYYACLSVQPINFTKTVALFSARAIGLPKFDINFDSNNEEKISWVNEFKYLGYWVTPKMGWGTMLKKTMTKQIDTHGSI